MNKIVIATLNIVSETFVIYMAIKNLEKMPIHFDK